MAAGPWFRRHFEELETAPLRDGDERRLASAGRYHRGGGVNGRHLLAILLLLLPVAPFSAAQGAPRVGESLDPEVAQFYRERGAP